MYRGITRVAAPLRVAMITALVAGLAACGGGGGGGGGFGLPVAAAPTPAPSEGTPTPAPAPAPAPTPSAIPTVSLDAPARAVADTLYRYTAVVNDGVAGAWRWIWGDGTPDGDANPAGHAWHRPGSFSLTVQATVGDALPSANQALTVVSRPVIAGAGFACGLKLDSTVACWGYNSKGQLGDGTTETRNTPVAVLGLNGVIGLGAGRSHACALKQDGTVACWGDNNYGQLGNASFTAHPTPTAVAGLSGVIALTGGEFHSCALKDDGTVVCWGHDLLGQLGDGTAGVSRHTPAPVTGLSGVVALGSGALHTCALKNDGTVSCWGSNYSSQLGNGNTEEIRATPVIASGLSNVVALSMGSLHSCALKADSTVACWGDNADGQLGDGTFESRAVPTAVTGLTGAAALGSAGHYSCALKADRTVACWGDNSSGQLGDNSTASRNTPVAVGSLTDVVALAAGDYSNCALKGDGTMACWGDNYNGNLGDGTDEQRLVPTPVSGGAVFWR